MIKDNNDTKNKHLKIVYWLCSRFIGRAYKEELMGDLEELYEERLERQGKFHASLMFWLDAIHLMIGFSPRRYFQSRHNQLALLKNYLKISSRNIVRYKFYSAINVLGLATGICMTMLITIHIRHELSYDTTYPKHELIYRLASTNYAAKPPIMGLEFKDKIPEVEEMARLFAFEPKVLTYEKEDQLVERPFLADHAIIELLDLKFIEGNKENALSDPLLLF